MQLTESTHKSKKITGNVRPAMTKHAWQRMNTRGISLEAVRAALVFGRVNHGKGAVQFSIGRREAKEFVEEDHKLHEYEGIHVVISKNGVVLTTYRNRNFKNLRSSRGRPACQRYK